MESLYFWDSFSLIQHSNSKPILKKLLLYKNNSTLISRFFPKLYPNPDSGGSFTKWLTEKSTNLSSQNKVTFKVPNKANKNNLKKSIEKIFKVNVTKINIINKQARTKLTRGRKIKVSGYKKAIITLKKGQSIDLTTGI